MGEQEATRITTEAANVGTVMHAILEHYVLNQEYDQEIISFTSKQRKWQQKSFLTLIVVWMKFGEQRLICVLMGYMLGTTDLVGVWKGKPTIMDFKQTNKPKKREWIDDYFLQGAAYGMAHNELYNTEIQNIAIFMCSRGEFQLFEVTKDEFQDWELKWAKRLQEYYQL